LSLFFHCDVQLSRCIGRDFLLSRLPLPLSLFVSYFRSLGFVFKVAFGASSLSYVFLDI